VSNKLPSREQAIGLLRKRHCSPKVIRHCELVADLALEIAVKLEKNGLKIDTELVEIGALLHDLGRSKTHGVDHGLVGAELAESAGLPGSVLRLIKRHVGGGITAQEAEAFGWPKDIYMPLTLEEKIVSYADKLIDKSKRVSVDVEINRLQMGNKDEAAERVRKLHEEIITLMDKPK
jgi:uncharacterized protein